MNMSGIEGAVSLGDRLATSESFKSLFREGMALVEETAAYLDGGGREEVRRLSRLGALAYATESMRLTTRLMQIASWLLLQRAVNDGELSQTEAATEKRKVRLSEQQVSNRPGRFCEIAAAARRNHREIAALAKPHSASRPADPSGRREEPRRKRPRGRLNRSSNCLRAAFTAGE